MNLFSGGVKMTSPPNKNLDAAIEQREKLLMDPNVLLALIDTNDYSTVTYYRNCVKEDDRLVHADLHYIKNVLKDIMDL